MTVHTHQKTDELHVFWIPADKSIPCEMKVVENSWKGLVSLINGYITVAYAAVTPRLPCGCPMRLVVNEEGEMMQLPPNDRATSMYSYTLVGDAVMVGEGPVRISEGEMQKDFFSLPEAMKNWRGPGHPLPEDLD